MATINASLSTEQFTKIHGSDLWVRDFSQAGIEAVLSKIEAAQGSDVLDWKKFFMAAAEIDYKVFCKQNLDQLDIEELSSKITGALEHLVEVDKEYTDDIYVKSEAAESRKAYDIHDVFKMFKDELIGDEGFKNAVFDLVHDKQEKVMQKLNNGKVLIFQHE